ncbi:MAG: Stk1 family PASTA domain-containing Ser/Thr kinase [Actinobacteria bacterium]|nr:Stk1 family PASTA domain-containing Ser/Thr kinase [Actinomycetota bacterium]
MSAIGPGSIIGDRYELGRQLGSGGMARVFLAHDRKLGREVAVKVLAERYAADPAFVERFRREATSAAALNHPNIVSVFDRGEVEGTYFIVMEYIAGIDLKRDIRERAPLAPVEAIDIMLQILNALAAAHRRDVVHRDVKPQNVMFTDDGRVKVTDFGIARAGSADLTEVGLIIGTAQYLSPEQAQGREVTSASDCYSAGIVLFEMLTGRLPFDGDRPVTVALKQVSDAPPNPTSVNPSIPPRLAAVVLRALEKRPEARFTRAEDFAQTLMRIRAEIADDDPTDVLLPATAATDVIGGTDATRMMSRQDARPAPAPRRAPTPRPPERRRRRGVLPFVLGGLALLAVALLAFFLFRPGAAQVDVPPGLQGGTAQEARAAIDAAGLKAIVDRIPNDASADTVLSVTPTSGTRVDRGSTVQLTVSAGPDLVTLPNVDGKDADQALSELSAKNFVPTRKDAFSDTVAKGLVIRTDPAGGGQVAPKSAVTVFVSKGPEQVTVPDVRNLTVPVATRLLSDRNLSIGMVREAPSDRSAGTIIRQNPGPTAKAAKNSAVDVVVAVAPDLTVPFGLIGQPVEDVKRKLVAAGFDGNLITSESATPTNGEAEGIVLDISPAPGSSARPDAVVNLTVSGGPQTPSTTGTGPTTSTDVPPPPGGVVP